MSAISQAWRTPGGREEGVVWRGWREGACGVKKRERGCGVEEREGEEWVEEAMDIIGGVSSHEEVSCYPLLHYMRLLYFLISHTASWQLCC